MIELLKVGISTNQKRSAKWLKKEETFLKENAGILTVTELELQLNKTSGTLYRKARELGLSLNTLEKAL